MPPSTDGVAIMLDCIILSGVGFATSEFIAGFISESSLCTCAPAWKSWHGWHESESNVVDALYLSDSLLAECLWFFLSENNLAPVILALYRAAICTFLDPLRSHIIWALLPRPAV